MTFEFFTFVKNDAFVIRQDFYSFFRKYQGNMQPALNIPTEGLQNGIFSLELRIIDF